MIASSFRGQGEGVTPKRRPRVLIPQGSVLVGRGKLCQEPRVITVLFNTRCEPVSPRLPEAKQVHNNRAHSSAPAQVEAS